MEQKKKKETVGLKCIRIATTQERGTLSCWRPFNVITTQYCIICYFYFYRVRIGERRGITTMPYKECHRRSKSIKAQLRRVFKPSVTAGAGAACAAQWVGRRERSFAIVVQQQQQQQRNATTRPGKMLIFIGRQETLACRRNRIRATRHTRSSSGNPSRPDNFRGPIKVTSAGQCAREALQVYFSSIEIELPHSGSSRPCIHMHCKPTQLELRANF